jgi:hypothetical protein
VVQHKLVATSFLSAATELLFNSPGQAALTGQTTAFLLAGGQTAWHLAAKDGHTAVLQGMAEAVRSLPPQQLKQLARFGSTADEIVTKLVQEEDTKSLTPLHLACIKGRAGAAAALMSLGVNPYVMVGAGRCLMVTVVPGIWCEPSRTTVWRLQHHQQQQMTAFSGCRAGVGCSSMAIVC